MEKKNTKKTILKIHRILGLATGLVVFIVSITGCLWAFKEEVEGTYNEYKTVVEENNAFLKASTVKELAEKILPNRAIHGVVFGQPNEALEVIFYEAEPEVFYQSVFLNPYTGEFIKRIDHTTGFFAFIMNGHMRLWLPQQIGSQVVAFSILLFLLIIISGIVLWWPKKLKGLTQRLKFKWNDKTRWKRKNFDLHTVLGFYASSFGLVLAFTGCVMAFGWFYFIAYKAFGGDKDPRFVTPNSEQVVTINKKEPKPYDDIVPMLMQKYKEAHSYEFHFPENDTTSILVEVENSKGLYYNMDYLFFDQYSSKELESGSIYGKYKNASFADKVIRMNYDIHIGAIGGLAGKIIAFLASLICASLPVTGTLLWYGKKFKKKKAVRKPSIRGLSLN